MKPPLTESDQTGMDVTAELVSLPIPFDPPAARHRARTRSVEQRAGIIRRLRFLARLLDDAVVIPGTRWSIGLDPVIGLAPGIGDGLSMAISGYIIFEGWRLGASRQTLARMVVNVAIDALLGLIPVAGDAADFAFKANQRNLRLLGITPVKPGEPLG